MNRRITIPHPHDTPTAPTGTDAAIAAAAAHPRTARGCTALAVAALLMTAGCQSLALVGGTRIGPWKVREKIPRATAENPAVRCVCLWQPATGVGLDNQTARGFAGQIFFFTNRSPEPVAVEGHLTIYVFDDQGTPEEQAHPIHTFEFRNDSFQPFLKTTQFGPAYELFIPYTRKGLHAAECALRVKLEQRSGPVVLSELGYVQLPGLKSKASATPPPTAAASPSLADARITPQPGKTIVHDLTHGGRPAASKEPNADERTGRPTADSLDKRIDAATAKARLQPAVNGGFLKTRAEIEPQIRAFLEQTLRKHAARSPDSARSAAERTADATPDTSGGRSPMSGPPASADTPRPTAQPGPIPRSDARPATAESKTETPNTERPARSRQDDEPSDRPRGPSVGRFRLRPAGE